MQITEGKAFPVGPSEDYSADVERTLGRLEKQEKSAASALNKAGKRTSQVAATSKLASAYTGAAASLGKLDVSPADTLLNAQLVDRAARPPAAPTRRPRPRARARIAPATRAQGSKALAAPQGHDRTRSPASTSAGYTLPASLTSGAAAFTRLPTLIKDKPKKKAASTSRAVDGRRRRRPRRRRRRHQTPRRRRRRSRGPTTQTQAADPEAERRQDAGHRRRRRLLELRSLRASSSRSW